MLIHRCRQRAAQWLTLAILVLLTPLSHADEAPRVATLDWTLAETLMGLGVTPLAVAQSDEYRTWVGTPPLPEDVVELGLRAQPNLELLARLAPDRILISPMFASLTPQLSRIAPVSTVSFYAPNQDPWTGIITATRQVAELVGHPVAAERLIAQSEAQLTEARRQLKEDIPPLLLVQFLDAQHVRVYGKGGLYQAVLEQLGLENAWHGPTNYWGFTLVGLEALADSDALLVIIEPIPESIEKQLTASEIWHHLDAVRHGRVLHLDQVWSFGALPSAQRFAHLLSEALSPNAAQE